MAMEPIHYETAHLATPGAPALALIHPLGADLRSWETVRALWGGRHGILAYDLPGAGQSRLPAAPPSPAERVAELEGLRQRLGLDRIVPVGVAIGAMVAALYAAAHPERTAALVLCNPAVGLSPAGRALTQERVAKLRAGGMAALSPQVVDLAFNDMPHDAEYHRYLDRFQAQDPRGYEMSALAGLQIDLTDVLPRITCPALVVYGEKDILFPPDQARRVAALLPRATLHPLPKAAHFPPVQDAPGFAAAVDAFLAERSAA